MMSAPRLITAPATGVVLLEEMKAHARIIAPEEEALVAGYIIAAESRLDGWNGILGRALITQTWSADLPAFPKGDMIRLPLGPAQSITSIDYFDTNGASQTLGAGNFRLHEDAFGPYVRRTAGATWPDTETRDDAVTVTWIAGFGDNPGDVPEPIRTAIAMLAAHLFENREATAPADLAEIPLGAADLIEPYRRGPVRGAG